MADRLSPNSGKKQPPVVSPTGAHYTSPTYASKSPDNAPHASPPAASAAQLERQRQLLHQEAVKRQELDFKREMERHAAKQQPVTFSPERNISTSNGAVEGSADTPPRRTTLHSGGEPLPKPEPSYDYSKVYDRDSRPLSRGAPSSYDWESEYGASGVPDSTSNATAPQGRANPAVASKVTYVDSGQMADPSDSDFNSVMESLVKCPNPHCHRSFLPDRLAVHLRSCYRINDGKRRAPSLSARSSRLSRGPGASAQVTSTSTSIKGKGKGKSKGKGKGKVKGKVKGKGGVPSSIPTVSELSDDEAVGGAIIVEEKEPVSVIVPSDTSSGPTSDDDMGGDLGTGGGDAPRHSLEGIQLPSSTPEGHRVGRRVSRSPASTSAPSFQVHHTRSHSSDLDDMAYSEGAGDIDTVSSTPRREARSPAPIGLSSSFHDDSDDYGGDNSDTDANGYPPHDTRSTRTSGLLDVMSSPHDGKDDGDRGHGYDVVDKPPKSPVPKLDLSRVSATDTPDFNLGGDDRDEDDDDDFIYKEGQYDDTPEDSESQSVEAVPESSTGSSRSARSRGLTREQQEEALRQLQLSWARQHPGRKATLTADHDDDDDDDDAADSDSENVGPGGSFGYRVRETSSARALEPRRKTQQRDPRSPERGGVQSARGPPRRSPTKRPGTAPSTGRDSNITSGAKSSSGSSSRFSKHMAVHACRHCNRTFALGRLEIHEKNCLRVFGGGKVRIGEPSAPPAAPSAVSRVANDSSKTKRRQSLIPRPKTAHAAETRTSRRRTMGPGQISNETNKRPHTASAIPSSTVRGRQSRKRSVSPLSPEKQAEADARRARSPDHRRVDVLPAARNFLRRGSRARGSSPPGRVGATNSSSSVVSTSRASTAALAAKKGLVPRSGNTPVVSAIPTSVPRKGDKNDIKAKPAPPAPPVAQVSLRDHPRNSPAKQTPSKSSQRAEADDTMNDVSTLSLTPTSPAPLVDDMALSDSPLVVLSPLPAHKHDSISPLAVSSDDVASSPASSSARGHPAAPPLQLAELEEFGEHSAPTTPVSASASQQGGESPQKGSARSPSQPKRSPATGKSPRHVTSPKDRSQRKNLTSSMEAARASSSSSSSSAAAAGASASPGVTKSKDRQPEASATSGARKHHASSSPITGKSDLKSDADLVTISPNKLEAAHRRQSRIPGQAAQTRSSSYQSRLAPKSNTVGKAVVAKESTPEQEPPATRANNASNGPPTPARLAQVVKASASAASLDDSTAALAPGERSLLVYHTFESDDNILGEVIIDGDTTVSELYDMVKDELDVHYKFIMKKRNIPIRHQTQGHKKATQFFRSRKDFIMIHKQKTPSPAKGGSVVSASGASPGKASPLKGSTASPSKLGGSPGSKVGPTTSSSSTTPAIVRGSPSPSTNKVSTRRTSGSGKTPPAGGGGGKVRPHPSPARVTGSKGASPTSSPVKSGVKASVTPSSKSKLSVSPSKAGYARATTSSSIRASKGDSPAAPRARTRSISPFKTRANQAKAAAAAAQEEREQRRLSGSSADPHQSGSGPTHTALSPRRSEPVALSPSSAAAAAAAAGSGVAPPHHPYHRSGIGAPPTPPGYLKHGFQGAIHHGHASPGMAAASPASSAASPYGHHGYGSPVGMHPGGLQTSPYGRPLSHTSPQFAHLAGGGPGSGPRFSQTR